MKSLKLLFLLGLCCSVVGSAKADLLPPDDMPTEPPTDKPTEQCQTDADCGPDYVCSFYTTDCAVAEPAPAVDPATGSGGSTGTTSPDGTTTNDCTPTTYSYCEYKPKPCTADSECTDGNVCIKVTYQSCGGDTPVSDGSDPAPTPGAPRDASGNTATDPTTGCTEVTEAYCGPKWAAPCKADADCGEGFNCIEAQECSAGGSTGSGGDSDPGTPVPMADAAGNPTDPATGPEGGTAECKGTGTFYCQLKPMPCAADSDCPADFTCVSFISPSTGTCSVDSNGNESCDKPTEPETMSECHPKNDYYPVPGGVGGPTFGGGVAEDGNDTPRDDGQAGGGSEEPVSAPSTTDKGDNNGAVTNDPASQTGGTTNPTGANADANADAEGGKTLGCAAHGEADATSGLGLLALLGLVVTFGSGRRRRA